MDLLQVLNYAVYLAGFGVDSVDLNGVVELVKKKQPDEHREYLKATVNYIKAKQGQGKLTGVTY